MQGGPSGFWGKPVERVKKSRTHISPQPTRSLCPTWVPLAQLHLNRLPAWVPSGESVLIRAPQPWRSGWSLPVSPPAFWLQTAGQMLNESAEPHKSRGFCSGQLSPPWTFVRVGDVVQIQRRGLHLGPAKYYQSPILCGPDSCYLNGVTCMNLLRELSESAGEPGCGRCEH